MHQNYKITNYTISKKKKKITKWTNTKQNQIKFVWNCVIFIICFVDVIAFVKSIVVALPLAAAFASCEMFDLW